MSKKGEKGWQFPDNNCTNNYGLEDAGTETFAGDSDGGLAREICQNSIDANQKKGKPTRVEFKKFTIPTKDIPGWSELRAEIIECFEYKGNDAKEGSQLKYLLDTINKEKIDCLRISDFNTTGLVGIMDDENDSPFYLLTKGSGTSDKAEGNGGSKGIGKYACFVASDLNTVFYSTKAYNEEKHREEKGYIGISKLRSRSMHNPERPNLMTMGTGYYAINSDNAPFKEELFLDKSFMRKDGEYGTDIYLIGYSSKHWKENIAYKVLEGFMGSIIFNDFEVQVDDLLINKDTLSDVISSNLFTCRSANERKWLNAQYVLFTDEDVKQKEVVIGDNSKIRIFVKTYNQKSESEASKRCEFIRYPYMRIKKLGIHTLLPYSAMCIIENNELCEKLRKIEDPAHTDWQFDRLKKSDSNMKNVRKMYKEMNDSIRDFIQECLHQDAGEQIDFEGAGEYLPAEENDEFGSEASTKDAASITPLKRVKVNTPKTSKSSEEGEGPEFSHGDPDGNEPGVRFPKDNPVPEPNPNPGPKPPVDDDDKGSSEGDTPAIIKVPLGGMKYKAIYNSKNKMIDIIFVSKYTEDNCELMLREVGLKEDKYEVLINSASLDGEPCEIKDGKIVNLKITENTKYKISCSVKNTERFSSEVVLNAIR